jgi:rubrerythrin
MTDVKTIPSMIADEKRSSKKYKRMADYQRKYGKKEYAIELDRISKDEKRHGKRLAKIYRL